VRAVIHLAKVLLLLLLAACGAGTAAPVITVERPTVIAFCAVESDEAVDDFQWYAGKVRQPLREAGIDFQIVEAAEFRVQLPGRRAKLFRARDVAVGYYLAAPDKEPRVVYGVTTDADLYEIVRETFAVTVPR
jgi:uncharacterized DUF497 family protein